jgi:protein-tyrosine-phosphatase
MAVDVEYWPTHDPSLATGSREQIMDAYRAVRDGLMKRIKERFVLPVSPVV